MRVALIDLSCLVVRHYKARANDERPNDAAQRTLDDIARVKGMVDHVIICLDAPPYWRAQEFPEYKAHRPKQDAELTSIKKWLLERIRADGYPLARAEGFEADDCIASICAQRSVSRQTEVLIVGADKDLAQCVTGAVKLYTLHSNETLDAEGVKTKFGVLPKDIPLYLALRGDASDGIPGVDGWGEKRTSAAIASGLDTIEKLGAAMVEALGGKEVSQQPMVWRKFAPCYPDKLRLWLRLTTLRTDVPLDIEELMRPKRTPEPLVEDDLEADPMFKEPDWDAVEESEQSIIAYELAADVISSPPPKAPSQPPPARAVAAGAERASPTGAPPAAAETAPRRDSLAANVVPATQGPAKPRSGDEIPSVAIERAAAPSWSLQLQPQSASEALHIAKVLFNSRMLSQFGSERGVFTVIMKGRELGMSALAALEAFHVVQDKPFPKANTLKALAERDPNCAWILVTHADDESATIETLHRGLNKVLSYTYTRERGEKAGYFTGSNKHNWLTKTQEMLEARATSKAVRRWYPASIMGMHSIEEELDNEH